jgi:high affinity cGMP-specific 3',5'-cyclic phosphodiesterase 9
MYTISWHTNLSARLGDLEVLILLVSCICHDLDHPGYNNIYQINARTELALRYVDDSSFFYDFLFFCACCTSI